MANDEKPHEQHEQTIDGTAKRTAVVILIVAGVFILNQCSIAINLSDISDELTDMNRQIECANQIQLAILKQDGSIAGIPKHCL